MGFKTTIQRALGDFVACEVAQWLPHMGGSSVWESSVSDIPIIF